MRMLLGVAESTRHGGGRGSACASECYARGVYIRMLPPYSSVHCVHVETPMSPFCDYLLLPYAEQIVTKCVVCLEQIVLPFFGIATICSNHTPTMLERAPRKHVRMRNRGRRDLPAARVSPAHLVVVQTSRRCLLWVNICTRLSTQCVCICRRIPCPEAYAFAPPLSPGPYNACGRHVTLCT
jgi:hypothetical protein